LIYLAQDEIVVLSKKYPEVKQIFTLLTRSFTIQRKKKLDWMNPDEKIVYVSRRHISDLYTGFAAPLVCAVLGFIIVLTLFKLLPQPVNHPFFTGRCSSPYCALSGQSTMPLTGRTITA